MPHAASAPLHHSPAVTSTARALVRFARMFAAGAAAGLVFSACGSTPLEPRQAATAFVKAVNGKDVAAMVSQAATPFHFRQAKSAPASGDAGGSERVAPTPYELGRLMQEVAKVTIAVATPDADAPPKADLLRDVLKGTPDVWGGLNLFVFRRDADDLHPTIVGVDAKGKIQAVYVS